MAKDALAPIPLAGGYAAIGFMTLVGLLPLAALRMPAPKPVATRKPAMSETCIGTGQLLSAEWDGARLSLTPGRSCPG